MATTGRLATVEQYWQLPEDQASQYELHRGEVSTPDGLTRTYKSGDLIPLPFAEGQSLSVDSVFAQE